MLEFQLVDSPFVFPQACVGCLSQKGPMVDTHRQIPGFGHIYICHVCGKTSARLLGFAKGERLDELSAASDGIVERDREIKSLREQLASTEQHLSDVRHANSVALEELRDEKAHSKRLETEIRRAAESTLAAVTG
jgi:hypothetical protein